MTLHHGRLDKVKITDYQVLGLLITKGLKLALAYFDAEEAERDLFCNNCFDTK